MGEVTHQQVDLMLKLYDLRREAKLREAREWYVGNFNVSSAEEMMQKYPPGSRDNTLMRMATSYWDMVASIVNRGLIDDELFFESNGEIWLIWQFLKPVVPAMRERFKNPTIYANLEKCAGRFEAWREKNAPGSNENMRQMIVQMRAMMAKTAAK